MSLKKMTFKRPRCENCGKKIYPKEKTFKIYVMGFRLNRGDLPLYCPNCGKDISNAKNAQVEAYETSIFCFWCIGSIIFIIIVFVIVATLR